MKKIYFFLLSFLLFFNSKVQGQDWLSAKSYGGTTNDQGNAIARDKFKNIYLGGSFSGTANMGSGNIVATGTQDGFVAKYDENGALKWLTQIGSSGEAEVTSVVVDVDGYTYAAGIWNDKILIGSDLLQTAGLTDIFLVKYDPFGGVEWHKTFGGIGADGAPHLALDAKGNCNLTGAFSDKITVENRDFTSRGQQDILIVSFSKNGVARWLKQAGGTENDNCLAIVTDKNGNSYLTGNFSGTSYFELQEITSKGNIDIFIAVYNASGKLVWVKSEGGISNDFSTGIELDKEGNIFIGGTFEETLELSSNSLVSAGAEDIFLAKYSSTGKFLWGKRSGGTSSDKGNAIGVDLQGNCYITGAFLDEANFDGQTFTSNGSFHDLFLAKYNKDGVLQKVTQAGGSDIDFPNGMAVDEAGNCVVTGYFLADATFGSTVLNWKGGTDVFLAKYGSQSPFISKMDPPAGLPGDYIIINGVNLTDASEVLFNEIASETVIVVSSTEIITTVPDGASDGYVKVVTPNGTATSLEVFKINQLPKITSVEDVIMVQEDSSSILSFSIYDLETSTDQLIVEAFATDTSLVKATNLLLAGNGDERTIQIVNPLEIGETEVTISVTDKDGGIATTTFSVQVDKRPNQPPVLKVQSNMGGCENAAISIPFTISDSDTDPESLSLTILSSDQLIVPDEDIIIEGTGKERVLKIQQAKSVGEATLEITLADEEGLYVTSNVEVKINSLPSKPIIDFTGTTEICEGTPITLNAPDGYDGYLWSDGSTTKSIDVVSTGKYAVQVKQGMCLSSVSDSVEITVVKPVKPIIKYANVDTLSTGAGAAKYIWIKDGTVLEDETKNWIRAAKGDYKVVTEYNSPCPADTSAVFIFEGYAPPKPTISSIGSPTVCEGYEVTLTVEQDFDTYTWSNGSTGKSIQVKKTDTLTITGALYGYTSAPSEPFKVEVVKKIKPEIALKSPDTLFVNTSGYQYFWFKDGKLMFDSFEKIKAGKGTYQVVIFSERACSPDTSAEFIFEGYVLEKPIIQVSNNMICEGDSVTLTVGEEFSSYSWSNGKSGKNIIVKEEGAYTVEVEKYGYNATSDEAVVTFLKKITPVISLKGTDSIQVLPASKKYRWFKDGVLIEDSSQTIKASKGRYSAVLTSDQSCLSDTASFQYNISGVVEDYFNKNIKVYPVPAKDELHIEARTNEWLTVNFYDSRGKVYHEERFLASGIKTINTSNWTTGLYLVHFNSAGMSCVRKILVE